MWSPGDRLVCGRNFFAGAAAAPSQRPGAFVEPIVLRSHLGGPCQPPSQRADDETKAASSILIFVDIYPRQWSSVARPHPALCGTPECDGPIATAKLQFAQFSRELPKARKYANPRPSFLAAIRCANHAKVKSSVFCNADMGNTIRSVNAEFHAQHRGERSRIGDAGTQFDR